MCSASKRTACALALLLALGGLRAAGADAAPAAPRVVCEGGVCRLADAPAAPAETTASPSARLAEGYLSPEAFVRFLNAEPGAPAPETQTPTPGSWAFLLFVVLGGLALNLTPCVLPMVPVNLAIVGRSVARGAAYGLGMTVAYGTLGVVAALGGRAFGELQATGLFNALVALVFVVLGLALCGAFSLDLTRFRRVRADASSGVAGWAAFGLGAMAALLAGACVAPVLVSVLVLAADAFARGETLALSWPFLLGLGMALPWPFAAAGLRVLPRPGAWMVWVNRAFALFVFALALRYGLLAARAWSRADKPTDYASVLKEISERPPPVLVECRASWCKNCAAMEKVMEDPEVKRALRRYSVLRLQAEDLSALRRVRGFENVRGLPAFLIFGEPAHE